MAVLAPIRPRLLPALVLAVVAGLLGTSVAHAHGPERGTIVAAPGRAPLEVRHGPVSVILQDEGSDGHQAGDLRVASVPTTDATGAPLGRLDATLITTAVDVPAPGDEIRISSLVFTFGEDGEHQVVVTGSAVYPASGPTLATGDRTTRPIAGGSGRFAGAGGRALSERLPDDSWRHLLVLTDEAPPFGVRRGPRSFRHVEPGDVRGELWAPSRQRDHSRGRGGGRLGSILRELLRDALVERSRGRARETLRSGTPESGTPEAGIGGDIVRRHLGGALPGSAPGHELGLWQYTVPPGAALDAHRHPGWQVARIVRGELSYVVLTGEGEVLAADGSSRPIGPGRHTLRAGDTVVENPDLEHFGANLTEEPVEIVAASLFTEGEPPAILLESPASPVPAASPLPAPTPGT